ncbi:hypothetical protein ACOCJ5_14765 [Knoellia sp. CPCC 206450]|uniref:hypothetical protein n=1 Tax=Knoellia tibetensis TaxID=3404798 RepID=UPI003B437337
MTDDGETRYNSKKKVWEQYEEPPGVWKEIGPDFGQPDEHVGEDQDGAGPGAGL